jgi:hypothetical protein
MRCHLGVSLIHKNYRMTIAMRPNITFRKHGVGGSQMVVQLISDIRLSDGMQPLNDGQAAGSIRPALREPVCCSGLNESSD